MSVPCAPPGDYQGKINIWGLFTGGRKSSVTYRSVLLLLVAWSDKYCRTAVPVG